ncbi:MAG: hypothetical protein HC927_03325 [Deltaproteobacteria bacterium]|nr:hypothetical protein [Deltaproteobacteria bacterium]
MSIGTPQKASAEVDGEEDLRSPECPAYSLCLSHVLAKGWNNWTCRGCDGPGSAQGKTRGDEPLLRNLPFQRRAKPALGYTRRDPAPTGAG